MKITATLNECKLIAMAAHQARGQRRHDGKTPYIEHLKRTVELTDEFYTGYFCTPGWRGLNFTWLRAAAWLHDIIEDTHITLDDLREWDVAEEVIYLVDLLTKKHDHTGLSDFSYYDKLTTHSGALLVKCADRCSNLESSLQDVEKCSGVLRSDKALFRRAQNSAQETTEKLLPRYENFPGLYAELKHRIILLEATIIEKRGADLGGTFDCGVPV